MLPFVLVIWTWTTLARAEAAPAAPSRAVLADKLWDDGKAEFSIYRGITPRYGQDRATEMRLIVVKEDLLNDTLVKSEAGPLPGKTVEAVKLNVVADFQTGTYTYHQMASVFFDRRTMEVLKEAMSHTESCGITYVRVAPRHGHWMHEAHSYWEGEADREVPLDWPAGRERLFWDALPVSLRPWVAEGRTLAADVWILPSQISGRSPLANTRPVAGRVHVRATETLQVPAGRFAARPIDVVTAAGTDRFWFAKDFPYPLLKMETSWGRSLALERTLRLDYWRHHMNGDERVLEPSPSR
jgi:hypothetical protein